MSPSTPIWLTPPLREECGHLFVFWHQWLNLDQNSGQGLFSIFWALVVCCTPALLGHMYGGWPTSSDACWASLLCRCCCGSPWSSGRSRHSSHILEPRPQETSCVHHTPWPHTKRTQGMSYLHLQDKACCSPNWWPSLKNKSANKKKKHLEDTLKIIQWNMNLQCTLDFKRLMWHHTQSCYMWTSKLMTDKWLIYVLPAL